MCIRDSANLVSMLISRGLCVTGFPASALLREQSLSIWFSDAHFSSYFDTERDINTAASTSEWIFTLLQNDQNAGKWLKRIGEHVKTCFEQEKATVNVDNLRQEEAGTLDLYYVTL
eukprot:TRINITY_DN4647_c0_g2_i3.p1 TRINITY_DN4647_c0_g2~~TRINITY_DN4647_c0_g2_i3.p1  ORF type:complete len:135 (+),score=24.47 TRINITY_DN4647_c0_g2_i3:60-407(+)